MRTTLKDRLLGRVEKSAGRLLDDDVPSDASTFEGASAPAVDADAATQIDLRDSDRAREQRRQAARRRREEENARNAAAERAAAVVTQSTPAD